MRQAALATSRLQAPALLAVTTMFIITVVKSSLALSLGLVGALSIVRFRAAIKEPEELTYLFFAISIGLGLGADQRVVTLAGEGVELAVATPSAQRLLLLDQALGSGPAGPAPMSPQGSFRLGSLCPVRPGAEARVGDQTGAFSAITSTGSTGRHRAWRST